MDFWLKGVVLGFSIAAPVGPIGLLCIQRTLDRGRQSGFISGLGAASADAVYGSLAAFGLSAVLIWLAPWQTAIQIGGALFLIGLGVMTMRKLPSMVQQGANSMTGLLKSYVSTFLLTLSNPATILSFLAIFSGAGLVSIQTSTGLSPLMMVIGVFCGSALWWLLLSFLVSIFRNRFLTDANLLRWINRVAGVILVAFGVVRIVQVLS